MPTFSNEAIANLTRSRFQEFADAEIAVSNAGQDGSDRQYYRVRADSTAGRKSSIVVMRYGTERVENEAFVPLTEFLQEIDVACPALLSHDQEDRLVWLQDLGDRDLCSYDSDDWEDVRFPLYREAVKEVLKFHQFSEPALRKHNPNLIERLEPAFDGGMYQWEQDYFFNHFARNFSTANEKTIAAAHDHRALRRLREELPRFGRCLIHRDFQSRNIMIREGHVHLIDYQGMRFGLPEYDLASLAFDPYVAFDDAQRHALLDFYREQAHHGGAVHLATTDSEFLARFHHCAIQRLMQALGAYGFLSLHKKKPHFLQSIEPATRNLRAVIANTPEFDFLLPLLELKEPEPDLPFHTSP